MFFTIPILVAFVILAIAFVASAVFPKRYPCTCTPIYADNQLLDVVMCGVCEEARIQDSITDSIAAGYSTMSDDELDEALMLAEEEYDHTAIMRIEEETWRREDGKYDSTQSQLDTQRAYSFDPGDIPF
jgi:hypothetical protein